MKHYKTPAGEIRAIDTKQSHLVQTDWSELTDEQLNEVLNPPPTLDDLSTTAMARINNGYTNAMAQILDEYPDAETLSFDKQEREAREYQQWQEIGGPEPATPYLDAMLSERPIGKHELVSRIIAKANAFVGAHGSATGRRQRLEDDIKAALQAEDRAALEAIGWSNSE